MARPSTELQPFCIALILVVVGLCTIPAEVQCSSSRRVYGYLRARVAYEGKFVVPLVSPPESRHGSTNDLKSPKNMQIAITTFSAPISPASAEMSLQQQPRQRLYSIPRSAFSMLPRGSVYLPPGPSLGSNTVVPPPDRP